MPDRWRPAAKFQAKIYQTIDRRASSSKQIYKSNAPPIETRLLTCTVATRPAADDVLFAGDGRSSSNLVVKTARRICEGSRLSSVGARGFVERLVADDVLHRIVMSQSSCLRTFLTVNRSSILSLRRRRRSLRLVTMTTAFVCRIT